MKTKSIRLILLLLLFILVPFLSHAFYTFPTKIDTKVERMNIQTVLNTVMVPSPNLKVDGVLGRKSIQVIQSFQESHGLTADGKVGPITRNTLEIAQTGNTTYTPSTTTSSGCLSGAIYNTQTGQPCTTTTYTTGCNGTNKYNTITGALCSNTTNTGGGGGTVYTVPTCTGYTTQSCIITNGIGTQSRTCNSGNWSSFGSCTLSSCNTGYSMNGNTCIVTTSTTPVCTGSTTQSCTITNGQGSQSRTCTNGTWSSYNTCTLTSCNTGYSISNNTCILTPTPDTTKPTINTFTLPTTSTSLNVPFTLSATDNTGVSGYFLSESSTTPNTSSGSWFTTPSSTYTFISEGLKTLYAWAKDAVGNISNSLSRQTTITLPTTPTNTLPSGLISWWKFDGNANDSQGSNNGTPSSGLTLTTTGCKSNQCYSFDANNDYITLASSNTLSSATYSFWISRGDASDDRLIFASDAYQSRIFLTTSGYIRLETNTNGQEFQYWNSVIPQNTPTHVLLSRNGNTMSLYINGTLSESTIVSGSSPLTISQIGLNGRSFRGILDEMMIWNRVLSATEASQVYNYFGTTTPPTTCTPESTSTTCSGKCGTQTNNCGTSVSCTACTTIATCYDGIQNQGEAGVDCGGPCSNFCSTIASTPIYIQAWGTDSAHMLVKVNGHDVDNNKYVTSSSTRYTVYAPMLQSAISSVTVTLDNSESWSSTVPDKNLYISSISIGNSSSLTLNQCSFTSNASYDGSKIYYSYNADATCNIAGTHTADCSNIMCGESRNGCGSCGSCSVGKCLWGHCVATPSRLHVSGNKLVNAQGQTVLLKGANYPDQGSGRDPSWDRKDKVETDFSTMASWGMNSVRLIVSPSPDDSYYHDPNGYMTKYLDREVSLASKNGMYALINFFVFNDLELHDMMMEFWDTMSKRYAGYDNVIYELFNEPHLGTWPHLIGWYEEAIDIIRANDPNALVIANGLEFGYDIHYALTDPVKRPNVAYGAHPYPGKVLDCGGVTGCTEAEMRASWDAKFGNVASKYPIVVTEVAWHPEPSGSQYDGKEWDATTENFGIPFIRYLNDKQIGYSIIGFTNRFAINLLSSMDPDYTPSPTMGSFIKQDLANYPVR